jgi:hypothetical protein
MPTKFSTFLFTVCATDVLSYNFTFIATNKLPKRPTVATTNSHAFRESYIESNITTNPPSFHATYDSTIQSTF